VTTERQDAISAAASSGLRHSPTIVAVIAVAFGVASVAVAGISASVQDAASTTNPTKTKYAFFKDIAPILRPKRLLSANLY
jgi:hypothetical protein